MRLLFHQQLKQSGYRILWVLFGWSLVSGATRYEVHRKRKAVVHFQTFIQ